MSGSRQDDPMSHDTARVVPAEDRPGDEDRARGVGDVASAPAAQRRDDGRDTTA